jgi:hypothetical protein
MTMIRLNEEATEEDLRQRDSVVINHQHFIPTRRIGDQQSCMAIASMLDHVRKGFSKKGMGRCRALWLDKMRSRPNPLSLGEQQYAMSLASWMVFQLESFWVYGHRSHENDVPAVMEDIPVGG